MTRRRVPRQACGCLLCPKHRVEPAIPFWVTALEAYCEHEWPAGAYGTSAVNRLMTQIKRHIRRESRVSGL